MADEINNTGIALARGNIYAFFTEAFIRLPNEDFIRTITSRQMETFLNQTETLHHPHIQNGIETIQNFIKEINSENRSRITEIMAIDRTRLIRPACKSDFNAPYEGLYTKNADSHSTILSVKKFYKRRGITPVSYANDSPDFFCTEMNFMEQLCLQKADNLYNAVEINALEKEFLNHHLGRWIGDYCKAAKKYARTGFYSGLLLFLEGFIDLEKSYVS